MKRNRNTNNVKKVNILEGLTIVCLGITLILIILDMFDLIPKQFLIGR